MFFLEYRHIKNILTIYVVVGMFLNPIRREDLRGVDLHQDGSWRLGGKTSYQSIR